MKKTIIIIIRDVLVLLTLLFIIDFVCGKIFSVALYNSPDGRYYKAIYSLEKSSEDILIIGSSKAETNFVSSIFSKKLNMSCWNAGRGGQTLIFFRSLQEATLKRYSPQILILNLRKDCLEGKFVSDRIGLLKPFYWKHQEIRPFIDKMSIYEKYFLISDLYAYNSTFYYLFRSYIFNGLDGEIEDLGWKPRRGKMNIDPSTIYGQQVFRESHPINAELKSELNLFLNAFSKAGTKVYIIISPDLQPSNNTTTFDELNQLANNYNIKIFDFSNDTSFLFKPWLFKDFYHLNVAGAELISNKIADQIIMEHQYVGLSIHQARINTALLPNKSLFDP